MASGRSVAVEVEGPDGPTRARRAVSGLLRDAESAELAALADDAAHVTTELVTNAMLHGAPPVTLRVELDSTTVRVAVEDASPAIPETGVATSEAMTGRGLALVSRIAHRWGIDRHEGGKTVWAELNTADPSGAPAQPEVDPELRARVARQGGDAQLVTVRLGDVPTELLLAAKAHVDNLVREFALAYSGAASGQAGKVPPQLASLLSSVTTRFAEARLAIKRQAIAAAAAGETRTNLVLTLSASSVAAAEDYLAALDEIDGYARAARLLTVETPPQHRVFRHWYLSALIEALRAARRGEPVPDPPSFESRLLSEVSAISHAYQASDRAARLQKVTAALATALNDEQVAEIVVSEGVEALGASGGSLVVPVGETRLSVPGAVGYSNELVAQLRDEPLDAPLPAAQAMRERQPVWLESRQERDQRFPALIGFEPETVAVCAVPLVAATGLRGALRFSFDTTRLFDEDERAFVLALAAETTSALERSDLYNAERSARTAAETTARRLAVLQELTAALAAAVTVSDITRIMITGTREALGASAATLCITEGQSMLRVVGAHGALPWPHEEGLVFPIDFELPSGRALQTGEPVVATDLAEFPHVAAQEAPRGLVCLPLIVQNQRLGTLTLAFDDVDPPPPAELDLLTTVAQQCATALQRVWLVDAERAARRRSGFLAEASQLLASSLEPAQTLENLVTLVVPRFADWAATYLVDEESGAIEPRGAPGGVREVLSTGRSLRYAELPADMARQAGQPAGHGVVVPLVVSGGVIGALALARFDPNQAYDDEDLRLAEDFAARAAVAIGNARAFARTRDAAVALQRSLLPQRLPRVPGLSFGWSYRPAGTGTLVGGDWYDVLEMENGRVAIVIGDVMGRGAQAAAVMGQLRATARAHATESLPPGEVLARLDAMLAGFELTAIATAFYGVLDIAERRLVMASAGHLPPLLLAEGTANSFLDVEPGPPLGTAAGTGYPEFSVDLPPGATLLLYTDGLVEDHTMPVEEGMGLLRKALRPMPPDELCDEALRALGRDKSHEDDTAVLAVTLDEGCAD